MGQLILTRNSIPEISAETLALADFLRTIPPGAVALYGDLSVVACANVQKEGRGRLRTACNIVRREEEMVFGAIRNLGLKHLHGNEITNAAHATIKGIKNKAQRGVHIISCLRNVGDLPPQEQIKAYATATMLNVFNEMASRKSVRRISQVMESMATPAQLASTAVFGLMLAQQAPRKQNKGEGQAKEP